MKSFKQVAFGTTPIQEVDPYLNLWILRILVNLGGTREFIQSRGFQNDLLAEFLGFDQTIDCEDYDDFKPNKVKQEIIIKAKLAEKQGTEHPLPKSLLKNLNQLAELVGLDTVEQKILGFVILLKTEQLLDTATDLLGQVVTNKTHRALSVILEIPEATVKMALSSNSCLYQSGLLKTDDGIRYISAKLDLFSAGFADAVITGSADPVELFRETVRKSSPATLNMFDYQHVNQLELLLPLIEEALAKKIKGINIYIYGPAGTGKTQLAKVIAERLNTELFEIACEDIEGDPISGERRLRALSAAQRFLKERKCMLLFDEVEDVFNDADGSGFSSGRSTAQKRKAWINRCLEENDIPSIWLSNTREGLDPAFIRRYAMVFELPVPPESQRKTVLEHYAGDFVSQNTLKQLAKSDKLAPAVIATTSKVIKIIENKISLSSDEAFTNLINQTLEAQNYNTIAVKPASAIIQSYSTRHLNTGVDIDTLLTGLKKHRAGRICFYGPPGTGKTALGKHIAEQLDMPIISKKVSELMSMYVGGTEKNIAHAFKRATDDKALLLIDEVDSFLQDRTGAQRSWEQTQVNEMLTQMENFEGVFIASTNLIDSLDAAAMRRFDAKILFGYLKPSQLIDMAIDFCTLHQIPYCTDTLSIEMAHLNAITPGDFALLCRQVNFNPVLNYNDLIARLEDEQQLKGESKNKMGFI